MRRECVSAFFASVLVATLSAPAAHAALQARHAGNFKALVAGDPAAQLGTIAETPAALGDTGAAERWNAFRLEGDSPWDVYVDRRSGAPLLVAGSAKGWIAPGAAADTVGTLADLDKKIRAYVAAHAALFRIDEKELQRSDAGSGALDESHWLVEFERRVGGVPVEGEHVLFYFSAGSLVAFGADRWGRIDGPAVPRIDADAARKALDTYASGLAAKAEEIAPPELVFSAEPASPSSDRAYRGANGFGVAHRLAWRITRRYERESGTWVAKVDAMSGEVFAFYDEAQYAQAKGGVYPLSDDQICPDGCEQLGWPMPFADVATGSGPATASSMGQFFCSPSQSAATTTLAGPYVRVADVCGAVSQSVVCDQDLDLGGSAGIDCAVPAGASAGNTHAARSSFYHLNRVMEKGRAWLPGNTWLQSQLVDNVNLNQTCNAYWDGSSVNFFKSGGGCRNTGEIAGVFVHEWGHGLDFNDGGGYDNPSEAYADVVAMFQTHQSCVGRGFFESQVCGGYGDACLSCTGIRDHDFAQHVLHTPVTPAGYVATYCPGGAGPCGKEVHCEGYVAGEALWDLAARDLQASGSDTPTSWQTAERLFYTSRQGSGGNAYNCALPSSDGCAVGSWFTKLRVLDDADGSLANGTPHAAAIYAAFARHGIACGLATDPSNQDHSSCPALATPTLTAAAAAGTATLTWSAVAGASDYRVLRNDASCSAGHTIIATVTSTSYVDSGLADGFEEHYAVQARASNPACLSAVSNCLSIAPQSTAGRVRLDRGVYACSGSLVVTVTDSNVGASTVQAKVASGAEPTPETLTLVESAPGSGRFVATLPLTSSPAVSGDGMLSLANGNVITASYTDADDGQGGTNVPRQTAASVDCIPPRISGVTVSSVTDTSAVVRWTTDEAADSRLTWGTTVPPGTTTVLSERASSHELTLSGLLPCSRYFFSVASQDAAGNLSQDDAGGSFHTFQTPPAAGAACHLGVVSFDRPVYGCNDTIVLSLADIDLDRDPSVPDTATVTVTSTSETVPETVHLVETGNATGIFTGSIATGPLPSAHDGILEVADRNTVSAVYRDADTGLGSGAVTLQTGLVDCAPPLISGITVTPLTDDSALVEWTTSEDASGWVDYGPTPAYGRTEYEQLPNLGTQHAVQVLGLFECERTYFRITATDRYGSTTDSGGAGFQFNAWTIPGAIYKQDFEGNHGWTLQGDWQVAAPQGLGTDLPDPALAEHGTKVLGVDLTGLAAHPGDYEPAAPLHYATSPVIVTPALPNAVLRFRMWLNTDPDAVATIDVHNDSWINVFTTSGYGWQDSQWETMDLGIGDNADGSDNFQIRFGQTGGTVGTIAESGWNIDRIELRDPRITTPVACRGCTGIPSFAGLATAQDVNGCAPSGVALAWDLAAGWGTGAGGTYSVYRSTSPTFVPSVTNRIATGLTTTTYTDVTTSTNTTLYYVVRAESDETCSTGPANHGVTDSNLVRRTARDDTSQPVPSSIGNTVRLSLIDGATVRVVWSAASNAAAYRVLRASSPQGPFGSLADVTAGPFDDLGRAPAGALEFYLVKGLDSCGNEGP